MTTHYTCTYIHIHIHVYTYTYTCTCTYTCTYTYYIYITCSHVNNLVSEGMDTQQWEPLGWKFLGTFLKFLGTFLIIKV